MNERYTFIDIYRKDLDLNKDTKVKVSQIIIPKIQRPYAQGRQDGVCTYVRNTLLNEMFANFKTDEIFDFNFIYGIVRPSNDEYVMELLILWVALSMKHVPLPLYFVISLLPIVLICLAKHHQE